MPRKYLIIVLCSVLFVPVILLTPITFRIIYGVVHGGILEFMGYPVDIAPWDLAKQIVETGKDPSFCLKLQDSIHGKYTTIESRRTNCIFEYAKITKDPSACELLLPSEYGLACLSTVWGKIMGPLPCMKADGSNRVTCHQDNTDEFVKIDNPQITNCSQYKHNDLQEWCYAESSTYLKNVFSCNKIETLLVKDDCQMNFSFKQKDPELCNVVTDFNRRRYCQIHINTWLNYPELRDSFYFGKKVPIDG